MVLVIFIYYFALFLFKLSVLFLISTTKKAILSLHLKGGLL